jgi:hypothetical protein
LKPAMVARSFNRSRDAEPFPSEARRALLNFGRFADDRRRPFFTFECLAKTVG